MNTTTDTTRTVAAWRRIGSEDRAADSDVRDDAPISDDDLASALAGHHSADLDALDDAARAEALAALVEGYRHGG